MRSVAVVLPASMWAMIPMFLVFSSGYSRATTCLLGCKKPPPARSPSPFEGHCHSGRGTGVRRGDRNPVFMSLEPFCFELVSVALGRSILPAVVGECLVRLRHFVGVVALFDGVATVL